ncbi:hypothetical protein COJ96_17205 [Bacillus sp. AFS073361]|uniref:CDP-glycerol glycerophosphotransferase family protein n=1 Tax=Bacillus sp. AFS073361 TaxID=2033511 RepID=UPI000BFA2D4B|nr:CDP-glycerol glycerophosphotransferase family protein [Bacillus sp. AFS073361]PFP26545.1 hypothetical protein COJ96_17205 [Bacillus sp. AFS073361]
MSIYLNNYWTLYQEFMDTFHELTFRGIPVAMVTNFYQQIDDALKAKMEKDDFYTELKTPFMKQTMIQPYFESFLENVRAPIVSQENTGKILINADYTRMTALTYKRWFNPQSTLILTRSKNTHVFGIPTEHIESYQEDNAKILKELETNAALIFKKYKGHPAFGNEYFQKTFLNRISLIVKTISSVFNLFNKSNISIIVVGTTEDILSRCLAIVGAAKGIKSICLQHGILMGEEAFMPVFTTFVGVYGEYEKTWYLQRGVTAEQIAAVGHPKYDDIFTYSPGKKEAFLKSFGLNANKLTLLVITGPNIDLIKFNKLIKNIADNPRFQIIIKPHPWEIGKRKYDAYLDLEKQYESVKVLTTRVNNLYELISHADGVVSSLSTVVSESILFNKPVFIFNFLISNRTYDYYDCFGDYIQTDPDILLKIVNRYYNSNQERVKYQSIRNQYLSQFYNDGSSGKKLINLIKLATK